MDAFVIRDAPGKGKAVFANRPLTKGEEILSETPLFTQSLARSVATIALALSSASVTEQREYLGLYNCHTASPLHPLMGIFQTNALPCGTNDPIAGKYATTAGIFLQGSRFNSSCVPNVNNFWDEFLGVIKFHAIKDIAEGEELCITYGNLLDTREGRRRSLKKKFAFDCTCEDCSLSGDELRASDNRRRSLKTLYDEIGRCGHNPRLGLQKVKESIRLLKEEGLLHEQDGRSYDAFQFCVCVSDFKSAKAWIKNAIEIREVLLGPDTLVDTWRQLLKDPKSHRNAGRLPRTTLSGPE